jgi:hypothetical protein
MQAGNSDKPVKQVLVHQQSPEQMEQYYKTQFPAIFDRKNIEQFAPEIPKPQATAKKVKAESGSFT